MVEIAEVNHFIFLYFNELISTVVQEFLQEGAKPVSSVSSQSLSILLLSSPALSYSAVYSLLRSGSLKYS